MHMEQACAEVLAAYLQPHTPETRERYALSFREFAEFVGRKTPTPALARLLTCVDGRAADAMVKQFVAYLLERHQAARTVNGHLSALRGLVRLARRRRITVWHLNVANLRPPPPQDPRAGDRQGCRRLIARAQNRRDRVGARDRAMMHLLVSNALTLKAIGFLDVADFDRDERTLRVQRRGSAGHEVKGLSRATVSYVAAWLRVRGGADGALFIRLDPAGRRQRLTRKSIRAITHQYADTKTKRFGPSDARRAAVGVTLTKTKGNVADVGTWSGHGSVAGVLAHDADRRPRPVRSRSVATKVCAYARNTTRSRRTRS